MSDANRSEEPTAARTPVSPGRRLARNLAMYTLARLAVVVVLTALIMGGAWLVSVQVPLVVAALFAIVIALPLSLTLFKSLRTEVNADIAVVDAGRRRDKAQLRARLRGDTDSEETDSAESSGRGDSAKPESGGPSDTGGSA